MPKTPSQDAKRRALQEHGCLIPRPEDVRDELFLRGDFFDPRDLVQVKYEMLRRVQTDGHTVSEAAAAFGFSRPSFYQAEAAFEQQGLVGLVPHKRGPKEAHKMTQQVMSFIRERRQQDPSLRAPALAQLIRERFDVVVHPRTIERSLVRSQKKLRKRR